MPCPCSRHASRHVESPRLAPGGSLRHVYSYRLALHSWLYTAGFTRLALHCWVGQLYTEHTLEYAGHGDVTRGTGALSADDVAAVEAHAHRK